LDIDRKEMSDLFTSLQWKNKFIDWSNGRTSVHSCSSAYSSSL